MSKKLLLILLPSILLMLGWCIWKSDESSSTSDNIDSLSWTNTMTDTNTPSLEDCKIAVEQYIESTKSFEIKSDIKVSKNSDIVVDYIWRLSDGTVFDTSVESVAKSCGLYTNQRNYTEWLSFIAGTGQMIAGFDAAVIGMSLNETKTITIPAKDAYGDSVVAIGVDKLPTKPDGSSYKAWESIMTVNWAITIESIDEKEFTIKNNHPLAWKDLIFDITLKNVK